MEICEREIRFRGKLVRTAYIDGEGYQFIPDPEAAIEILKQSGVRADLFTFIQRLSETAPLYRFPMETDNFAVLPVTTFENWMAKQISSRIRSTVRKTEKDGVEVREVPFGDELIRGISEIYNETPVRQGRRFGHYGIDLESLRRMKATFLERSIFIGAFLQGQLIGFAKLVFDESKTQAGLMHILSTVRHRDKAPTNALIAQAVRSCAQRNIPNLWYVNFYYGKKGHDSLAEFKRRNGFQKVDIPRFYVPLTVKGRLALRFGLHHEISSWIPAPVSETYRKARTAWYEKRFAGVEHA